MQQTARPVMHVVFHSVHREFFSNPLSQFDLYSTGICSILNVVTTLKTLVLWANSRKDFTLADSSFMQARP